MTTISEIAARPRPPVPFEAQQAATKWLVENRSRFEDTCNFAVFSSSGAFEEYIKRPCHGNINGNRHSDIQCVATDITVDRRQAWYKWFNSRNGQDVRNKDWSLDWTRVEPFLKWFLYESFASPFIINKDDFEFVKNYGIIVTAHCPAPLLQNIMIASRYPLECSAYSFDMFNSLTAKGVDPIIAYVLCFSVASSKYTFNGDPAKTLVSFSSPHRTCPGASLNGIKAMLRGFDMQGPLSVDHNYTIFRNYRGGSAFFETGDFIKELLNVNNDLREALSAYRSRQTELEVYTPPNPFAPPSNLSSPVLSPGRYTYTEMYECLIPFITTSQLLKE